MSFSTPLPGARVTSLCLAKEKSPRERPPREPVLSTSLCSGFASARRGSPKAHPCACGELAHVLRAPADKANCLVSLRARPRWPSSKLIGAPVLRRGPDEKARRVGAMDCAHLPPRQGWRVGKPGRPERIFRPWMDEKRSTGVAFSLVTFSWPGKRKLPARPGGARKTTWTSNLKRRVSAYPHPALRSRYARVRFASPLPAGEGNRASKTCHARPAHAIVPRAPVGIEPREPEAAPEQRQRYQRQHETRTRRARIDA